MFNAQSQSNTNFFQGQRISLSILAKCNVTKNYLSKTIQNLVERYSYKSQSAETSGFKLVLPTKCGPVLHCLVLLLHHSSFHYPLDIQANVFYCYGFDSSPQINNSEYIVDSN